MPTTQIAAFQWRVHIKGAGFRYFAFYAVPRQPFQSATFQLRQRDSAGETIVGLYTQAQYEHRVSQVIERADCEII